MDCSHNKKIQKPAVIAFLILMRKLLQKHIGRSFDKIKNMNKSLLVCKARDIKNIGDDDEDVEILIEDDDYDDKALHYYSGISAGGNSDVAIINSNVCSSNQ